MTAVTSPASAPTPDATPKARARGRATTATVMPANAVTLVKFTVTVFPATVTPDAGWSAASIPNVAVDIRGPAEPLERYRLAVAPSLFMLDPVAAAGLVRWVEAGGILYLGAAVGLSVLLAARDLLRRDAPPATRATRECSATPTWRIDNWRSSASPTMKSRWRSCGR